MYRHLRPRGIIAIQVFDPLLDYCVPMDGPPPNPDRGVGHLPARGTDVRIRSLHRTNDPLTQVLTERWEFAELDDIGTVVRRDEELLRMRWTYRYEMRYLLQLAGFEIEAEFSDFHGSPPRYGAEQIWIARRPDR
jgi:hypothetical protein